MRRTRRPRRPAATCRPPNRPRRRDTLLPAPWRHRQPPPAGGADRYRASCRGTRRRSVAVRHLLEHGVRPVRTPPPSVLTARPLRIPEVWQGRLPLSWYAARSGPELKFRLHITPTL